MGIEWIIVIAAACAAAAALAVGFGVSAAKKNRRRREAEAEAWRAAEAAAQQAEEPAEAAAQQAEEPAKAEEKQAEEPAEQAAPQAEEPAKAEEKQAEEPAEQAAQQAEKPAEEAEKQAEKPAVTEQKRAAEGKAAPKARRTILYRMEFSYSAKLYQSSPEQKEFYGAIVQEARAFPKVRRAVSWRQERIYAGRKKLALLVFRGKRLCIALALDPEEWEETKYHGIDVGDVKRYEKTPMMLRITSARKAKYACALLRIAAERAELAREEVPAEELDLPYRTTEELLGAGLIRMIASGKGAEGDVYEKASVGAMIREKISLGEARTLISDEEAKRILEENTEPSAAAESAGEDELPAPGAAEPALLLAGKQPAAALPPPAERQGLPAPAGQGERAEEPPAGKEEARSVRGHINIDTLAAHFEPYA